MTTMVKQRADDDCAVCSIAMATGLPYEEVLEKIGDAYKPGEGMYHPSIALERLGFKYTFENGIPVGDIVCKHRGILSPDFFRSFAWGRRALLSVPSLNIPGGMHMVYWDGAQVFDPSNKKIYTEWKQLLPTHIVLFREMPTRANLT